MLDLARIIGFDWDEGNARKNDKHDVSNAEAEQIFFNVPLLVATDAKHSDKESRLHALGVTDDGRRLQISFTVRDEGRKVRVISARDMNRKERIIYEQQGA
jgi:uncharacterized DUF497 family protein